MLCDEPLIITGTPRSGQSAVARAFWEAGLHLGDQLDAGGIRETAGLLEDAEISALHREWLAERGEEWPHIGRVARPMESPASSERAAALIQKKFFDRAVWGFKDPQAVLFCKLWRRLLPRARCVLVVREPARVVWSYLVSGLLDEISVQPLQRSRTALHLWMLHARCVLEQVQRNAEHCLLLVEPHDFTGPAEVERVQQFLRRWCPELQPVAPAAYYRPHWIKQKTPRWVALFTRAHPRALLLWREILKLREQQWAREDRAAEFPCSGIGSKRRAKQPCEELRPDTGARKLAPVICVASRERFVYSETFVQDQVHRLAGDVRFLYGKSAAGRDQHHLPLCSPFERVLDAVLWEFGVFTDRMNRTALRRYLRRERVAAVLAEFGPKGAEMAPACAAEGVPLVVHFHGYDAYSQPCLDEYADAYQELFRYAAAVIAVSRDMEQQLVRLGAPAHKIFYNPCGVDTAYFHGGDPAAALPDFLSVGRFVGKKGPILTLLAFRQVLDICPAARLFMVGDGPLLETARQLVGALGMETAVSLLGVRPQWEVAAWMRRVRAFVQHSLVEGDGNSEGTPVGVLEAGASGLPVVSTRHAGIADVVVHEETGLLVAERDVEGMARAMLLVAQDPEHAARLGRAARARVAAHYSLEKNIQRLNDIIAAAIVEKDSMRSES